MFDENHAQNEQKKGLVDTEWAIVISLVMIMASFVIVAKVNALRSSSILKDNPIPSHALCKIVIDGEVAKPGTFMVAPGTQLKKILKKCAPTPFADLKQIDQNLVVEGSAYYNITKLSEITVCIEGLSSERVHLKVPAGTRICNLKTYISFNEDHKKFLYKNRRILRDGDVISLESVGHGSKID